MPKPVIEIARLERFLETTTFHGLADAYFSGNRSLRIVWTALIIGAVGSTIFGCFSILNGYRESPIVASYVVKGTESSFALPDVIICPFNRLNADYLRSTNLSVEVAHYMQLAFGANAKHPAQRSALTNFISVNGLKELDDKMKIELDRLNMTFDQFLDMASLKCKDVLLDCNGPDGPYDCCQNSTDIMTFAGRCYRLHNFDQVATGYGHGLSIVVNLPKPLYVVSFNNWLNDGVVVKLAERSHGLEFDLNVLPVGSHALMPIKAVKYEFINDPPNFQCLENSDVGYSRVECFDGCVMESAEKECGCALVSKYNKSRHMPSCTTLQYFQCVFAKLETRLSDQTARELYFYHCRQRCKPRCHYWRYDASVSYAKFSWEKAATFVRDDQAEFAKLKNTIILDVYLEKLEYTLIKHHRAMSVHGFIAELGGQCSLWLGGSILSFVQLLVFCVKFCVSRISSYIL